MAAAASADKSQLPGKYVNADADDFGPPLSNLLIDVGLLGTDNKNQKDGLNELQEGALSGTKWLSSIVGSAGLVGLVTALGAAFSSGKEPTRVALTAGGSVIATACIIAVALVVRRDVSARAQSTVAQYAARGQISAAFLALARSLLEPAPAHEKNGSRDFLYAYLRNENKLLVKAKNHGGEMRVTAGPRILGTGGELEIQLDDGDWVPVSDIEAFRPDVK